MKLLPHHIIGIRKAIDKIHSNLGAKLNLDILAKTAGMSKYHFLRLFQQFTGETPKSYIRRLQHESAKKAGVDLKCSITELALDLGFATPSAFSEAFTKMHGMSFSDFMRRVERDPESLMCFFDPGNFSLPWQTLDFETLPFYFVRSKGPYHLSVKKAWAKLRDCLQQAGDPPQEVRFFGIGQDNPHESDIATEEIRFDAGLTGPDDYMKSLQLKSGKIPGGQVAQFEHQGSPESIDLCIHWIYGCWLESSDFNIRLQPPFVEFLDYNSNVPEYEWRYLINVPIQNN